MQAKQERAKVFFILECAKLAENSFTTSGFNNFTDKLPVSNDSQDQPQIALMILGTVRRRPKRGWIQTIFEIQKQQYTKLYGGFMNKGTGDTEFIIVMGHSTKVNPFGGVW